MFRRSLVLIPHVFRALVSPGNLPNRSATRSSQSASHPATATPSVLHKPKRKRWRVSEISTLDPSRLRSSDFINVSNLKQPSLYIDSHNAFLHYGRRPNAVPFPPDTHGFLYYHHDPELPLTAGEIRFRVTPNDDVAGFKSGKDLVGPYGVPWAMGLVMLTKATYEPFKTRLLEDGLFDPGLMRTIQEAWSQQINSAKQTSLHYLEQPFSMHMSSAVYLRVFTPQAIGATRILRVFMDQRIAIFAFPYSGRILVRFERSTLPEHAGARTIVMRVLKILEPIKVIIPGYDMRLPVPKEGSLIQTYDHQRLLRAYSINLDKAIKEYKDLGLLWPQVCDVQVVRKAGT